MSSGFQSFHDRWRRPEFLLQSKRSRSSSTQKNLVHLQRRRSAHHRPTNWVILLNQHKAINRKRLGNTQYLKSPRFLLSTTRTLHPNKVECLVSGILICEIAHEFNYSGGKLLVSWYTERLDFLELRKALNYHQPLVGTNMNWHDAIVFVRNWSCRVNSQPTVKKYAWTFFLSY